MQHDAKAIATLSSKQLFTNIYNSVLGVCVAAVPSRQTHASPTVSSVESRTAFSNIAAHAVLRMTYLGAS